MKKNKQTKRKQGLVSKKIDTSQSKVWKEGAQQIRVIRRGRGYEESLLLFSL